MVQRLCGICPVSHHLAAAPRRWTSSSARCTHADRRQDAPPDALRARSCSRTRCTSSICPRPTCCSASARRSAGATSSASRRRIPDVAKKGVLLRKFGQEVIRLTAGKRPRHRRGCRAASTVHLTAPSASEPARGDIDQMVAWCRRGGIIRKLHHRTGAYDQFGTFESRPTAWSAPTAPGPLPRRACALRMPTADHPVR